MGLLAGDGLNFVTYFGFKFLSHFVLIELRNQLIGLGDYGLLLGHLVNVPMFIPVNFFVKVFDLNSLLNKAAILVPQVEHMRKMDLPNGVVKHWVKNKHADEHTVAGSYTLVSVFIDGFEYY